MNLPLDTMINIHIGLGENSFESISCILHGFIKELPTIHHVNISNFVDPFVADFGVTTNIDFNLVAMDNEDLVT